MIEGITVEICCGSLTDVIHASSIAEVDRIELNCALELGGLTPSMHTFLSARKESDKKIICMVRPRGAGFIYNAYEKETMYNDAKSFLENHADGIVFGALNKDHAIDEVFTQKMVELIHSYGKEAVFHKAFDNTEDPASAIQTLIQCIVDRILTSGQKPSTEDGIALIRDLQKTYGDRIELLPGGGVTKKNAKKILRETGCMQIHMTAKSEYEDDGTYYAVDPHKIKEVLQSLRLSNRTLTAADHSMLKNDSYESRMYAHEEDDHDQW
jgi:copper homeostasis protein